VRVIHVDNSPERSSVTARTLDAGITAYNAALDTRQEPLDFEVLTFDEYDALRTPINPDPALFFVTVSESELSHKNHDGQVVACRSLETARTIAAQNSKGKVFLIAVAAANELTGIDAVVAGLNGVAGIIDERGLILKEVVESTVHHVPNSRRRKSLMLVGELGSRITAMKEMLSDWEIDADSEPTLDLACWRAAIALAQLKRLEPIITVPQPTSYSSLANALNLNESATAFRLNSNDLRRVLSTLGRRWLGEGHDPPERLNLPRYARRSGFPRHRPVIIGLDHLKTDRQILSAFQNLEIKAVANLAGMNHWLVYLPASMRRQGRLSCR